MDLCLHDGVKLRYSTCGESVQPLQSLTTRWVGMSENMRVSVILEMNGCLPYVAGIEGSTTPKIMNNPFFRNTIIYEKYVFCKCIYKMKPCMCKKIALCK
jgi:hypothetical protein